MNISEKLLQIAEGDRETVELNKQLEETLYGIDHGGKSYYDMFWDAYQQNGNRRDYQYGAFGGIGWNDNTYKPKYPVIATQPYNMFTGCKITEIKDVDFSGATNLNGVFYVCSSLLRVGVIDASLVTYATNCFNYCSKLTTIEKLIVSNKFVFEDSTFKNCTALESIVFEGEIASNINFQWSTLLTTDSIKSIITHLSDNASGKALTLSKTAVDNAFTTEEWETYLTKNKPSGWTITLV
jgi:hypothetical protein